MPLANSRLDGPSDTTNEAIIRGPSGFGDIHPHAVNVRDRPGMHQAPPVFWFHAGDSVRVVGYVHSWAAVEFTDAATGTGRLGFIHEHLLNPRP